MKALTISLIPIFCCAADLCAEAIAKGDKLSITVVGSGIPKPEIATINNVYPVGKNGTINMPYLGSYRAAGIEPVILVLQLAKAYREADIYANPKFRVTIKDAVDEKK